MNEGQFLRHQIATERRHLAEVKSACERAIAAAFGEPALGRFCERCAAYFVFVAGRLNAQSAVHEELLRPRLAAEEAVYRKVLDELEGALTASRAAVTRLAEVLAARRSDQASAAALVSGTKCYLEDSDDRLQGLEAALAPLCERHYRLADWRAAGRISADTILEERALYGAVQAELPTGIELRVSGRSAA